LRRRDRGLRRQLPLTFHSSTFTVSHLYHLPPLPSSIFTIFHDIAHGLCAYQHVDEAFVISSISGSGVLIITFLQPQTASHVFHLGKVDKLTFWSGVLCEMRPEKAIGLGGLGTIDIAFLTMHAWRQHCRSSAEPSLNVHAKHANVG
jgi:hypothetical protein